MNVHMCAHVCLPVHVHMCAQMPMAVFVFILRTSQCSLGWPLTHDPAASDAWVLELNM